MTAKFHAQSVIKGLRDIFDFHVNKYTGEVHMMLKGKKPCEQMIHRVWFGPSGVKSRDFAQFMLLEDYENQDGKGEYHETTKDKGESYASTGRDKPSHKPSPGS